MTAGLTPYSTDMAPCDRCGWVTREDGSCSRCAGRAVAVSLTRLERTYIALRLLGVSCVADTTGNRLWSDALLRCYPDEHSLAAALARVQTAAAHWRKEKCPM